MQASSLDARVRRLFAAVTVAMLSVLIVGCDGGPATQHGQSTVNSSSSPATAAHQGPGQSPESCKNVDGTAIISGTATPNSQGNVVASGPVEGDVTGTFTLVRDPDAPTQQGNGTTFAFYKEARLETDQHGIFTGTANGNFNIGLGEEGRRSNRVVVHVDYSGPSSKRGFMEMTGPFDFSDFPPIIRAELKYSGRLCPGS